MLKSFDRAKYEYLRMRYIGFKFIEGINEFTILCEICGKKKDGSGRMSRYGNPYEMKSDGSNFHHKDGNNKNNVLENIQFLCENCHRMLHRWGTLRRWMIRNGIRFKDLPQENLKSWMFLR